MSLAEKLQSIREGAKQRLGADDLRQMAQATAELRQSLQAVYLRFGIDLPRVNGEPSWTLSIPVRYVVRRDGTIAAADADPDYTSRPEPEKTLDDLRRLS